jgi:hypothetical protein
MENPASALALLGLGLVNSAEVNIAQSGGHMQTVRRLYFYLVSLISLEVVIWGVIYLARTLFDVQSEAFTANLLATGLSLILVGLPIFLLHWIIIQRHALRNGDERATVVRAVFLYAVQLAVLIPVVQNVLAIFTRTLMPMLNLSPRMAFIGGEQTLLDNLVAIIVNLVAWAYFTRVLRDDWQAGLVDHHLMEVRRLYRYIWMLYGLVFTVVGVQNLLRYLLNSIGGITGIYYEWLGNGIPMAVVGGLIWSQVWRGIQRGADDPDERRSTLRSVVLYLVTLVSALIFVIMSIGFFTELARLALGVITSLQEFLAAAGEQIALLVPVAVLWAYYEGQRKAHVQKDIESIRQPGVERFYRYILAFIGLVSTFAGTWLLLESLVQLLFGARMPFIAQELLSPGLANLLIGLPVWLLNWIPLQNQAREITNAGEQARRSLIRKIYLYTILFISIIGVMVAGGRLFFLAFTQVLGTATPDFGLEFTRRLVVLLLVALWLAYHLAALRRDGAQIQRSLTDRHVRFNTLIIQRGEDNFADLVIEALQRQAPQLPVAVHHIETASFTEEMMTAKAVVVPSSLAIHSPEALRVWLSEYHGQQIFVPQPLNGWTYLGAPSRTQHQLAQDTAHLLRELAEGQDARRATPMSPWMIAAIVIAGIFTVPPLLLILLSFAFRGF